MPTYAFLSEEWIEAARKIYDAAEERAAHEGGSGGTSITMNLVINNVPFRDSSLIAHARTTDGVFRVDLGPFENAEVKLTLDYKIARSILLDGDAQVGMRAFLGGKIKVEGNMAKLLALQNARTSPAEAEALDKLRAMTEKGN